MNIPNTNNSSEEITENVVKINVCCTYGPIEETSVSLLVDESEFKPEIHFVPNHPHGISNEIYLNISPKC